MFNLKWTEVENKLFSHGIHYPNFNCCSRKASIPQNHKRRGKKEQIQEERLGKAGAGNKPNLQKMEIKLTQFFFATTIDLFFRIFISSTTPGAAPAP